MRANLKACVQGWAGAESLLYFAFKKYKLFTCFMKFAKICGAIGDNNDTIKYTYWDTKYFV